MSPRRSSLLTAVLCLLVLSLLGALSQRHRLDLDWSDSQRNSLSSASRLLLDGLNGPVSATAYVFADLEARRAIRSRFAPYLRHKADFSLDMIDPVQDPQSVRSLNIAESGEVILRYQGRQERLTRLSEADISAALQRLAYAGQSRIAFVQGHGERDPDNEGQSGYSALKRILEERGLKVDSLSLATQTVPADIHLLVLAAPQTALLAAEQQQLQAYLERGGNLLWLLDPGLPVPQGLAGSLGIQLQAGTVIYQDYELLGSGHPAIALVAEYPPHPASDQFKQLTAFPLSGGLQATAQSTDWQQLPLLRSVERAWLETGPLEGSLIFHEDQDIYGPITLGISLTRPTAQQEQRVLAIADSDFAANAYLPQLGNRAFSVGLIQWLSQREAMIRVDLPQAPDAELHLSPLAVQAIAGSFLLGLPGLLFGMGLYRARQRRNRR